MKTSQAIILTTLTTLLILLQSFFTPANANDTNSVTFSLIIQNYHGSPLKDVKVQLINSTGYVVDSGTSGSDGKVTLTGWKNETYTLKAIYLGREVGSIENLNCTSPPKTIRVGVFNVKIRIMSYGGLDPVPNAEVNITSSETTPKVDKRKVTDSNGYVVFENLPNGTAYRVDIKYEDKVAVTDSEEINLSDKYDFTLTINLYRLTLRLKDGSHQPVEGVVVKLWRGQATGEPFASVQSGADGNATFKLLPSGSYVFKVEYRSEYVYESDPFTLNNNKIVDVSLPLKSLIVNIKSKSGNTAAGFTFTGKLMYDSNTYAETTTNDGILNFGIVYGNRDYVLKVLFEGSEVYSGVIKGADIGAMSITGSIGDFSIKVSTSELFGKLKETSSDMSLRIKIGKFQVEKRLSEGSITYHDYPLVKYSYELLLDSDVVGSGTLEALQHQTIYTITPDSKELKVAALSLDNKPLSGKLVLMFSNGEKIGEIDVSEDSTTIRGLLRLRYNYRFYYMNIQVAEGVIEKESVDKSKFEITASVSDVKVTALDYSAENKLVGASIVLSVGDYKSTKMTDSDGAATFEKVPLTRVTTTIYYKGVRVYSSPEELSPTRTTLTISGTGVYKVGIKVLDGEKEPLTNGELEGLVGDYKLEGMLDRNGTITASLVPNGTMTIRVKYLTVTVYEGSHKIERDGQLIEIVAKIYTVRVNAYKSTVRGDVPLENARIHFEKDGEEIVAGDVRNGVFQYKLPASNYNVWIEYQGVKVGEKMVQHNGPTQVSMPTEVYEVSLFVVDLAENPISGIDVKFVRNDKLITTGSTDSEGKLIVSLAKGEYDVECAIEGKKYSYLIAVNGVGSKVLLAERTDNLQLLTPLIASASLGGIAIFSLAMSFRVRTPRRGAARGGGGMDWRRPQRKPIKKNV
jgi:hypothetical protein